MAVQYRQSTAERSSGLEVSCIEGWKDVMSAMKQEDERGCRCEEVVRRLGVQMCEEGKERARRRDRGFS